MLGLMVMAVTMETMETMVTIVVAAVAAVVAVVAVVAAVVMLVMLVMRVSRCVKRIWMRRNTAESSSLARHSGGVCGTKGWGALGVVLVRGR